MQGKKSKKYDPPAHHVHGAYIAALGVVFAKALSAKEIIEMLG